MALAPEVHAVLRALVSGVRPILGSNFVGAYLQGSLAAGGADGGSDADFLIIVNDDVPEAHAPALQAVHVRVYDLDSDWAKHLEGSYFPRGWLRDLSAVGRPLLYVDNGSRVLERSPHDNTLVVRWVLREHGLTLAGPPPGELLDPVPAEPLRQEVYAAMRQWGSDLLADPREMNNDWYQPYAVLSFSRMLLTLATGRVWSKPAGAAWAQRTLDGRWAGLIQRGLDAHPSQRLRGRQPADPVDFDATLRYIRYVLELSDAYIQQSLEVDA